MGVRIHSGGAVLCVRARRWLPTLGIPLVACGTSSAPGIATTHDAGAHRVDAASTLRRDAASSETSTPPNGPALPVPPIGHAGRWLTDAEGRVLLVHGVNVVEKAAPYYPAAEGFSDGDASWLSDNGFRVVRLGILATGLMPTPGVVDTSYIAQIDATVQVLAAHDVYSLLDFHQDGWGPVVGSDGFPAWMTLTRGAASVDAGFPYYYEQSPALQQAFQSFWDDAMGPDGRGLQEDYAAMFSAVAQVVKGEPYVLGYDLLNEPWPGTTWQPCLNDAAGCPSLDSSELGPAYAKAVAAIRTAGDQHLVFGEPFVLFNFGTSTTSVAVPGMDSNAGMSFHVYPIIPAQAPNVIQNAVAWSTQTNGALLNTEWGATTDSTILISESLALDSALVPWIFWSFDSELVPTFGMPPGGANLVASTAAALIQAYPLAVAGTPTQLTVDPSTQTLSFTWSTTRADGGSFARGTVTTLEAPALTYPNGYTVAVTNGAVTSMPCAALLTVESAPGASSVSVVVKPAATCP